MQVSIQTIKNMILDDQTFEFTIRNDESETEKTYRIERADGVDETRPWFVSVKQTSDYFSYLGEIWGAYKNIPCPLYFEKGRKCKLGNDTRSIRGIKAFFRWFHREQVPPMIELHCGESGLCFSAAMSFV